MTEQAKQVDKQEERQAARMVPPVDVIEDTDGITLIADLPGVPKEKLNLRVDGDALMIEGETVLDPPMGMEAGYTEVTLPGYRRSFTLSRELDPGNIEASLKDGVLRLRIPKAEHAKPRRIEVKAG
ncbi:MAG: Hsp20/alpha crystallin family protein [Gammaproteobacteria bacterium]